jgi:hypothetical protein
MLYHDDNYDPDSDSGNCFWRDNSHNCDYDDVIVIKINIQCKNIADFIINTDWYKHDK